jgi:iron complex outermembrane recepter protein
MRLARRLGLSINLSYQESSMLKRTTLAKSLLIAFGGSTALYGGAALAQDQPTQELQRVIVTGSNIKRTDTETPSPVQVITAEDLKASGFTSTQDVLHNLTANGQGTLSQGFGGAFAEGASGISLRGLTVGATLILIDGKRMAPYPIGDDGQRSFVDISNIPFDAIERIEVLKDGASAIYGSDAIAGVVNVILKKKYVGASINADVGTSFKNDGQTYGVSGIWGFGDLDKDGRNFYISGEIRKQRQIRYSDRDMSSRDFTSSGGNDLSLGVITPFNSNPNSLTGYVKNNVDTADTTKYFRPGCDQAALDAKGCKYEDTWSYIQPQTENYNLVGKYTQNLGSDWQASVSGSFFERKLKAPAAPSSTRTTGFQGIALGPGVGPTLLPVVPRTTIPSTNPAFPQSAKDAGLASGNLYYTFLKELGPSITDIDSKTSRLAFDLTGRLGNWELQAAAGYSEIKLRLIDTGLIDPRNLQSALNDGSLAPGITPAGASVFSFISPTLERNDKSSLWYGHLGANTELTTLPGGPLQLAVGTDYYERKQDATSARQIADGLMSGISNNFTIGKQKVASGYAEVVAPVTKTLELDGAVRYDYYNISGGKASPKVGFKFKPINEVLLRGTASTGFRAPGPAENGNAGQTYFAGVTNDPILCSDGNPKTPGNFPSQCKVNVGTIQSTNKEVKSETSKAFTLGLIVEPIKDLSFSLDLFQIELNKQIVTLGGDPIRGTNFTPIPQLQPDGVTLIDTVPPVAPTAYQTATYINANSTKVAGVDVGARYKVRIDGLGTFKTDFLWSYMPKYDLTIDGVTYNLAGTHGPFVISGNTGNPKSRIQWSNTISQDRWSVTGTINYIGSFNLTDPSFGYNTCFDALDGNLASTIYSDEYDAGNVPAATSCKVASFTTFDVSGRFDVTKNFSVHGSITNLLNRRYPNDWNTYGSQSFAPYNPSLHSAGAIGRYFNIGATYTF